MMATSTFSKVTKEKRVLFATDFFIETSRMFPYLEKTFLKKTSGNQYKSSQFSDHDRR